MICQATGVHREALVAHELRHPNVVSTLKWVCRFFSFELLLCCIVLGCCAVVACLVHATFRFVQRALHLCQSPPAPRVRVVACSRGVRS